MITSPGFYELTAEEYHADPICEPSLSSSIAVDLVTRSPAHARLKHPRLTPGTSGSSETSAMSFGSVVHELALGKGGGFAVWPGDSWRGNEAHEFKANAVATGKTPIKQSDFDRAKAVFNNLRLQLTSMDLGYVLTEGASEQVAVWKDRDHWMRAMFDRWLPERGEIWDIKTTGKSAHPEAISRLITSMNYDMRSEFYLLGAEKLTGKPSSHALGFCFLFIEVEPPFCVTPCFMDSSFKARGRMRAKEAVDTWARCMDAGIWPGYTDKVVEITAPGWVDYEIEDTGITASGEKVI